MMLSTAAPAAIASNIYSMSSKPDSMLAIAIWTWDDGSARLCEAVALEDRAAEHDLEELLDGAPPLTTKRRRPPKPFLIALNTMLSSSGAACAATDGVSCYVDHV
jgi:hypothetical protein